MDRHAKKQEKKRKARELAKKQARSSAARRPGEQELLLRAASRGGFGPCFISVGWQDMNAPALLSLVVSRELPNGLVLPIVMLVDRTCLGVKDAFVAPTLRSPDVAGLADRLGFAHGGMTSCAPLLAQSIVFHAIDFARKLGFEPHPGFPAALFEPRPTELLETPWRAANRPIYIAGPDDDVARVMKQLTATVGHGNFDYEDPLTVLSDGEEEDDREPWIEEEDEEGSADQLVHSPLECDVTRDGVTVRIFIYKGASDSGWLLDVEDHLGGSTVWDQVFATDQAAFDAAMQAIEEDGIASFTVTATGSGHP